LYLASTDVEIKFEGFTLLKVLHPMGYTIG